MASGTAIRRAGPDQPRLKVAGIWTYLYRAADSAGDTMEFILSPKRNLPAAKLFLLPEIAVVRKKSTEYFYRHPGPRDIVLLIEVADTSLHMDRAIKSRLYARCAVDLYWVVDIPSRRIIVYRNPGPDEYNSITTYQAHDQVPFEEMLVSLDQIFPAQ